MSSKFCFYLKMIALAVILMMGLQSCSLTQPIDPMMKIHQGQTQEEVLALLGSPTYRRFNNQQEEWEYRRHNMYGDQKVSVITFVKRLVTKLDSFQIDAPPRPVIQRPVTKVIEREVHHDNQGQRRGEEYQEGVSDHCLLSDQEFRRIYRDINSSFSKDQMSKLKYYVKFQPFSCRQTVKLLSIFNFEDKKLAALRVLAPMIHDRRNIRIVINSFIREDKAAAILGYPRD